MAMMLAALVVVLGGTTGAASADPAVRAASGRRSTLAAIYEKSSPAVLRVFHDRGYASGTVVTEDGLLVTHIDIAKKDELEVLTSDGRRLKARLLLRDTTTQLAILRLEAPVAAPAEAPKEKPATGAAAAAEAAPAVAEAAAIAEAAPAVAAEVSKPAETPATPAVPEVKWPFLPLGRSGGAVVGSWVATVAYPVGSDMRQFTLPAFSAGVLAGRGKFESDMKYTGELLLTDATSNAGSQGGGLINAEGELIGILAMPVLYRPTGSALNVALPAEVIEPLLKKAVESPDPPLARSAPAAGQAYLGVERDVTAGNCRISGVKEGSPAEAAGLKAGDVIVAIDGNPVTDFDALAGLLSKAKPGSVIKVGVLRAADEAGAPAAAMELKVTLGKRE